VPKRAVAFKKTLNQAESYTTKACVALLGFYRRFISPIKPKVCRFYPSCSQYTQEALIKYGLFKGLLMGSKRLARCHPFNPGGYHPVE
jgi:uncharacterized protein